MTLSHNPAVGSTPDFWGSLVCTWWNDRKGRTPEATEIPAPIMNTTFLSGWAIKEASSRIAFVPRVLLLGREFLDFLCSGWLLFRRRELRDLASLGLVSMFSEIAWVAQVLASSGSLSASGDGDTGLRWVDSEQEFIRKEWFDRIWRVSRVENEWDCWFLRLLCVNENSDETKGNEWPASLSVQSQRLAHNLDQSMINLCCSSLPMMVIERESCWINAADIIMTDEWMRHKQPCLKGGQVVRNLWSVVAWSVNQFQYFFKIQK